MKKDAYTKSLQAEYGVLMQAFPDLSEKDIDAIFTGVSGAQSLRSVLAKLDSKQQALILGHAVPMPVVVRTRPYDETFYAEIGDISWEEMPSPTLFRAAEAARMDLGF